MTSSSPEPIIHDMKGCLRDKLEDIVREREDLSNTVDRYILEAKETLHLIQGQSTISEQQFRACVKLFDLCYLACSHLIVVAKELFENEHPELMNRDESKCESEMDSSSYSFCALHRKLTHQRIETLEKRFESLERQQLIKGKEGGDTTRISTRNSDVECVQKRVNSKAIQCDLLEDSSSHYPDSQRTTASSEHNSRDQQQISEENKFAAKEHDRTIDYCGLVGSNVQSLFLSTEPSPPRQTLEIQEITTEGETDTHVCPSVTSRKDNSADCDVVEVCIEFQESVRTASQQIGSQQRRQQLEGCDKEKDGTIPVTNVFSSCHSQTPPIERNSPRNDLRNLQQNVPIFDVRNKITASGGQHQHPSCYQHPHHQQHGEQPHQQRKPKQPPHLRRNREHYHSQPQLQEQHLAEECFRNPQERLYNGERSAESVTDSPRFPGVSRSEQDVKVSSVNRRMYMLGGDVHLDIDDLGTPYQNFQGSQASSFIMVPRTHNLRRGQSHGCQVQSGTFLALSPSTMIFNETTRVQSSEEPFRVICATDACDPLSQTKFVSDTGHMNLVHQAGNVMKRQIQRLREDDDVIARGAHPDNNARGYVSPQGRDSVQRWKEQLVQTNNVIHKNNPQEHLGRHVADRPQTADKLECNRNVRSSKTPRPLLDLDIALGELPSSNVTGSDPIEYHSCSGDQGGARGDVMAMPPQTQQKRNSHVLRHLAARSSAEAPTVEMDKSVSPYESLKGSSPPGVKLHRASSTSGLNPQHAPKATAADTNRSDRQTQGRRNRRNIPRTDSKLTPEVTDNALPHPKVAAAAAAATPAAQTTKAVPKTTAVTATMATATTTTTTAHLARRETLATSATSVTAATKAPDSTKTASSHGKANAVNGDGAKSDGDCIVCIKRIPRDLEETKILELVKGHGRVIKLYFIKNRRTGCFQGVSYVKFSTPLEASKAAETLNGSDLNGSVIEAHLHGTQRTTSRFDQALDNIRRLQE